MLTSFQTSFPVRQTDTSLTAWVRWHQKGKTSLDFNEARDGVTVASAGPYADHCFSFQTDNHASSSSLNFSQLPDTLCYAEPTMSKH